MTSFGDTERTRCLNFAMRRNAGARRGLGPQPMELRQELPAEYHEPHSSAKGFREIAEVETRAFVESSLGGWNAGGITGADSVVVAVSGPKASDAFAIALLKETIARRSK